MERINKILTNVSFLNYLKKNTESEKARIYCHHDMTHFLDVSRVAYIITLEENLNINKEVLYAMGLLHDIGRWMEYEKGIDHAVAGKQLAKEIMEECDFNEAEIKEVLSAIEGHRKSGANSVLGDVLYRADKLSRNCVLCSARATCKNFQKGEKPILLY